MRLSHCTSLRCGDGGMCNVRYVFAIVGVLFLTDALLLLPSNILHKILLGAIVWLLIAVPTALLWSTICHFSGARSDEFSRDLPDIFPRKP